MFDAILFDLDKTLYPPGAGLQEEGDRRITQFMCDRLSIGEEEADALRVELWDRHGTSARGLEVEHGIPQRDVYDFAMDCLDPREFLRPAPALREMLLSLPQRICVFTNATPAYTRRVLDALEIADAVDCIFDVEWMDWVCKPHLATYHRVLGALGTTPERVLFVEDREENLVPAAELGMTTVLIGEKSDVADFVICDILDLPAVLQALEEGGCERGCGSPRP